MAITLRGRSLYEGDHKDRPYGGSPLQKKDGDVLFDKTIEGLAGATYYAGLRHKIIANNIANVETPGYRSMDISFREQLEYLVKMASDRKQVRGGSGVDRRPPPTLIFASDPTSQRHSINRNTVSIDQELVKLSQNTILHNTYLQLLNSKFRMIKYAISGNV